MSGEETRRCRATGLQLRAVRDDRMFRVAQFSYGALSAPERVAGEDVAAWGRFDAPGRTLYTSGDQEIAYCEVLSQFKRQLGAWDPLEADARALGLTREELLEIAAQEWGVVSFMGVGAVPASWRHARGLYEVYAQGAGWWIDLDHPASLAVLEERIRDLLIESDVRSLTMAVLAGENRRITTAIGSSLRRLELDDGTNARGLQFRSKFGKASCRAIWLPQEGEAWSADLIALSPEPILVSDEALARASENFRIRVF